MSEFVRIRHPETLGEADVPAGSVPAWTALGWEAVSDPRSFGQAQDEQTIAAQAAAVEQASARVAAQATAGDRKDQILARVGDDPVLAAEALRVENEKTQPRTTLVAELERIAGQQPADPATTTTGAAPAPDQGE